MEALLVLGWVLTVLGGLLYLHRSEERAKNERAELFQRIQAPQMAVMDYAEVPPVKSIAFDDDEQFWAARDD